ncbi:MAG: hypothetical protein PUC65_13930 [Clostridiales bacterium]|nr:hypothetical protein [Clostridiales bacterium]
MKKEEKSFQEIRMEMINYTIHQMESDQKDLCELGLETAVDILKGQLKFIESHKAFRPDQKEVVNLIHMTFHREKMLVDQLIRNGNVSRSVGTLYKLLAKKSHNFGIQSSWLTIRILYRKRRLKHMDEKYQEKRGRIMAEYYEIQEFVSHKVIAFLLQICTIENKKEVHMLIRYYMDKLKKKEMFFEQNPSQAMVKQQLARAFEIETVFIEDALESGMISARMAQELREQISYDELIYLN